MNSRMRHTVPVVIVAVALGAGSTLLVASSGASTTDVKRPRVAVSDCKPAPARCGSEESDLTIVAANQAARRMLETVATTESGESPEQAGLASESLVPEAWGALIDYESLAAENGASSRQTGLASGSLVPEAWGALIDYESLAAVAR